MSWWRTLTNWRAAPGVDAAREKVPKPPTRWQRPVAASLAFSSVNVPPEMLGMVGDGLPAPRVSRDQALSVPAVKRGRDLICGTLGTLRLKKHDARRRTVPSELLDQPEIDVARSVSMTHTVEDMLFEGRAWWRITEFDATGYPARVVRLDPRSVTVREQSRVYVSSTTGITQGHALTYVPDAELIRIDSPNEALLVAGARAIRSSLALERAAARYSEDPFPLGILTPKEGMEADGETEADEILDDFEDARSRRAWAYLDGVEPHVLQWNPEQLQLASARDYAVLEISRLLGVDPEELGVSTTSRTYANAEQRRLDLIDFTLAAYVTAIEDRLSMPDVTPPGYYVRAEYAGFLRSDTETRMRTYETGRKVGVYDDERIAEIEDIPTERVRAAIKSATPAPAPPAAPAPQANQPQPEETTVDSTSTLHAVNFAADTEPAVTIGFNLDGITAEFKADATKRTVSGLLLPWNTVAWSRGYKWAFAPGSLHWSNESRVKLDRDHEYGSELGRALTLTNGNVGLSGAFKVARGATGDDMLALAEDGVYDGFSVSVTFDSEADGWTAHPDDPNVRLVHSATLRKVAITAMPAFDDARVAAVSARREEPVMSAPAAVQPSTTPGTPTGQTTPTAPDMAAFTAGLTEAVSAAVSTAFERLPLPQIDPNAVPPRQTVPAGRAVVTREAPVYSMNGQGPSFVRDAWKARTEGSHEARERIEKFQRQTEDVARQSADALAAAQFAVDTTSAAAVIPPGYRPDMYVTQLMQGRPLVDSVSRGTLTDATPFTIPKFTSATGATADHVEGTNPTAGTLDIDTVTVTPGGISGLFELTREIVDSANPAIDAIAMQAMQESYAQQSEAKIYTLLNGAGGQGGVITGGFVPSGAQVSTTAGGSAAAGTFGGAELIAGVRAALALYPFRRFAAPNRAHLSQEATSALATAVGSDGRPLLPSVGAQNTAGVGNSVTQGWFVDGLPHQATWSMTGNAAGDADVLTFNSNDIWAWESALLTFRFEERGGPARIDLALFGYFACQILRPVGLTAIRHTVGA